MKLILGDPKSNYVNDFYFSDLFAILMIILMPLVKLTLIFGLMCSRLPSTWSDNCILEIRGGNFVPMIIGSMIESFCLWIVQMIFHFEDLDLDNTDLSKD